MSAGANLILNWKAELLNLEEQIEALQEAKRDFYAKVREDHGKPTATGLKNAMKLHRMDAAKREQSDQIDAETFRILSIMEGQSRAPRATRVENIEEIPPYDPETGEIIDAVPSAGGEAGAPISESEPEEATDASGDHLREPAAVGSGQIAREGDAPREAEDGEDCEITHPGTEHEPGPRAPQDQGESPTASSAGMEGSEDRQPNYEREVVYAPPGEVVIEHCPPEGVRWHPYAACFPMLAGDALDALQADIQKTFEGVREPIVKIGRDILDGRARYTIARELKLYYPVVQYDGDDPLRDVIAWNLHSRSFSARELRQIAKSLGELEPDRKDEIFEQLGVGAGVEAA